MPCPAKIDSSLSVTVSILVTEDLTYMARFMHSRRSMRRAPMSGGESNDDEITGGDRNCE